MHTYMKSKGEDLWTVGYYDPSGKWCPLSDHNSEPDAIERVNYLNGGRRA